MVCSRSWARQLDSFSQPAFFSLLSNKLSDQQFFDYGWRIPFIASALLVWVGLYVRLKLTETPEFLKVLEQQGTGKSTGEGGFC